MISVQNVSYIAGRKKILNDISFQLSPGEMLAVIGANGAGKSTLLKLLCREMNAQSGSIQFNGKAINAYAIKELAQLRSVLTQHSTVSLLFTVKELVLMGRYPHFEHHPSSLDLWVIDEVMRETGITDFALRDYNTLSGGEQQRVQLARVIAQIYDKPNAFLFLDEPTNGLDLLYQQQILQLARNMADRGYTVISILHDINFASRYADKILILKDGQTVAFGEPKNVINCENIHRAFNIHVKLMDCEGLKCPLVIPSGVLV
ncbi:heme ABC transporter ATP-binding protein [Mucilaginibacter paludis]|uniref:ABC transporter related protein n=1 Tax=Mucilaginibacter paludis DSM 18603 TaxID=714943 RepID=H1YEK6_9SPHI|nr:heme ABC transporter ATP-binding protein [Mucilaginibacter paludis]EHQ30766.1 ABC transporter related protein [Mucilaginibacter paludis DSM 18603]